MFRSCTFSVSFNCDNMIMTQLGTPQHSVQWITKTGEQFVTNVDQQRLKLMVTVSFLLSDLSTSLSSVDDDDYNQEVPCCCLYSIKMTLMSVYIWLPVWHTCGMWLWWLMMNGISGMLEAQNERLSAHSVASRYHLYHFTFDCVWQREWDH